MNHDNCSEAFAGGLIIGWGLTFFGILALGQLNDHMMLEKCELNLPRNQHCEIITYPKIAKPKEVQ